MWDGVFIDFLSLGIPVNIIMIKISKNVLSIIQNFKMFRNLWLIVGDFRDNSVLLPSRSVSFNWFLRADFGNLRFSLHVRSDWLPDQKKSNFVTSI